MKKVLIGSYLLIIICIIVFIFIDPFKNSKVPDEKAIASGGKIYHEQCINCHDKTGKGEGAKLGTAINNQHFLNTVSNKTLVNYVTYGREGTLMPGYSQKLSKKDLNNLVAFIRNWQSETINFAVPDTISGSLENGKQLYQLYCRTCHGEHGSGKAQMGPAIANKDYLKYTSDKQIWITVAYGRENTRMGPSLKGLEGVRQLTKDDISDIVTYIRSQHAK